MALLCASYLSVSSSTFFSCSSIFLGSSSSALSMRRPSSMAFSPMPSMREAALAASHSSCELYKCMLKLSAPLSVFMLSVLLYKFFLVCEGVGVVGRVVPVVGRVPRVLLVIVLRGGGSIEQEVLVCVIVQDVLRGIAYCLGPADDDAPDAVGSTSLVGFRMFVSDREVVSPKKSPTCISRSLLPMACARVAVWTSSRMARAT